MRTLIYVPIIHSAADMGSLGKELKRKSVSGLGAAAWQMHVDTVNGYWDAIESYFENIDIYIKGTKVYQDGMFIDGEIAMKIISDGIKAGSKNSEIVLKLINRGAILMSTEDFKLVKEEYDGLMSILKSGNKFMKLIRLLRYKLGKSSLLIRRDKFIAGRIDETLEQDETGILFIGAYHDTMKQLPKDIAVIELKEVEKIRAYQKAIMSRLKVKSQKLEELSQYLIKK